jgi:hypothetical protein
LPLFVKIIKSCDNPFAHISFGTTDVTFINFWQKIIPSEKFVSHRMYQLGTTRPRRKSHFPMPKNCCAMWASRSVLRDLPRLRGCCPLSSAALEQSPSAAGSSWLCFDAVAGSAGSFRDFTAAKIWSWPAVPKNKSVLRGKHLTRTLFKEFYFSKRYRQ